VPVTIPVIIVVFDVSILDGIYSSSCTERHQYLDAVAFINVIQTQLVATDLQTAFVEVQLEVQVFVLVLVLTRFLFSKVPEPFTQIRHQ